jgi:RNA polymerase sigma factor (sigma-70 family)
MARAVQAEALQHVRMLFEAGAVGGLTDRQLLERFRARDGEIAELAFAALVDRHGPMILRVCRRTLRDEHDAQDAFQATFLVLVRRAGSLRAQESLGGWLHGVACRVAACARAATARRRAHERKAAETAMDTARRNGSGWDDLGTVLHEEIGRLPAVYRAAVVLCDLEGLTQEQAAQRLGCRSGTVRSRLARGRGRLQARLTRRGLAPAAGGLAALLTTEAATAEVPAVLASETVSAATLVAAGQTIAGAVTATALTGTVIRTMFMTKLKILAAGLLLIGAGAGGTVVMALQQESGRTGQAGVQVTAETEPRDTQQGVPRDAEAARVAETPQDGTPRNVGEIRLRETELNRAVDRLVWALRMNAKRYYADGALAKDHEGVEKAILTLEQVWAKEKPRPKLPEEKSPEERRRDEISILTKEIDRVQAESRWAEMSLHRLAARVQPSSDAEREMAEAEVAAARALCALRKADLRVLELRLSQAKRKP